MSNDKSRTFDDYSTDELLSMPPEELMAAASQKFKLDLPPSVDSVDNIRKIGRLLTQTTSEYSFLVNMTEMAKMRKRTLKRAHADKEEIEDALTREEIFSNYAEIMKVTYQAVSRMVTIKQMINEELKFTDGK